MGTLGGLMAGLTALFSAQTEGESTTREPQPAPTPL